MAVTIKELISTKNDLNTFIKKSLASIVFELYELPEVKYRDYAHYEECPTGLDIAVCDIHGFSENYYLTWDQLEQICLT